MQLQLQLVMVVVVVVVLQWHLVRLRFTHMHTYTYHFLWSRENETRNRNRNGKGGMGLEQIQLRLADQRPYLNGLWLPVVSCWVAHSPTQSSPAQDPLNSSEGSQMRKRSSIHSFIYDYFVCVWDCECVFPCCWEFEIELEERRDDASDGSSSSSSSSSFLPETVVIIISSCCSNPWGKILSKLSLSSQSEGGEGEGDARAGLFVDYNWLRGTCLYVYILLLL